MQDRAIKYNDYMSSMMGMPGANGSQSNQASAQPSGGMLTRFFEIPFRHVIQHIADYQIDEKKKKNMDPQFKELF